MVEAAVGGVPQVVTRRGIPAAVVISAEEYERMTAGRARTTSLAEYLLGMPPALEDPDEFERIPLEPRNLRR